MRATSSPAPRWRRRWSRSRCYLAAGGYPFAQVSRASTAIPTRSRSASIYIVDEGPRVYIERIDIRGNTRTRDYVIRREFDIAEGDAFNRVLIDRAERRLRNLGYFKDVHVTTEPGSSDDRVVVVVAVVEDQTGQFSFGIGYSSSDGIVGDVSLSEKNFLGRGYNLRASVGGGTSAQSYEFGITDPYFFGRRISAGVDVYRHVNGTNNYPLLRLQDDRRRAHLRLPDHRGFHHPDGLQGRAAGDQRRGHEVRFA